MVLLLRFDTGLIWMAPLMTEPPVMAGAAGAVPSTLKVKLYSWVLPAIS